MPYHLLQQYLSLFHHHVRPLANTNVFSIVNPQRACARGL